MTTVIADITMSLDGYVTGAGAGPGRGLGDAEELHAWVSERDEVDSDILRDATAMSGAVIMGRGLYDVVDGAGGWTAEMGYGAQEAGTPPFFVVTRSAPAESRLVRELGLRVTFTDSLPSAIDRAATIAGDGAVVLMGGGELIGRALEAGLVDELRLHLAPLVLGVGTPLFRPGTRRHYRQREVRPSRNACHLVYERITSSTPGT
ncbi:dihydrofolate reductase family protein [Nocardia sp. NPDC057227]|uniref:dihydrofolate reductase family protein n=1 Tax=Nocardia sp. NPDC057227 TaxID=3346056 RepID=UPI00362D477C